MVVIDYIIMHLDKIASISKIKGTFFKSKRI